MRALALVLSCLVAVLCVTACAGAEPADGEKTKADAAAGTGDSGLGGEDGATGADAAGSGGDSATGTSDTAKPLDTAGSDAAEDAGIPWDMAAPTCDPKASKIDQWFNCAPAKGTGTKSHGQKCEKDDDCMYGRCMFGLPHAGYDKSVGFCTKNCGFKGGGMDATSCATENKGSDTFYCTFEFTGPKVGGKNEMRDPSHDVYKACTRGCKTDAECAAYNPELPVCLKTSTKVLSVNPNGACAKNP